MLKGVEGQAAYTRRQVKLDESVGKLLGPSRLKDMMVVYSHCHRSRLTRASNSLQCDNAPKTDQGRGHETEVPNFVKQNSHRLDECF